MIGAAPDEETLETVKEILEDGPDAKRLPWLQLFAFRRLLTPEDFVTVRATKFKLISLMRSEVYFTQKRLLFDLSFFGLARPVLPSYFFFIEMIWRY